MDYRIVAAIVAAIAALVVALVNYRLGRQSEKKAKKTEIRTKSYIDFINCVSEIAMLEKCGKEIDMTILQRLADAKTRLAIYGDKNVIRELAKFDKNYGVLNSEEAIDSFVKIIMEMREDAIGKRKYDISKEIKQIIFGNKT